MVSKVNNTITSYKIRPVEIYDDEVNQMLESHLISDPLLPRDEKLSKTRSIMAHQIFATSLNHDIICLQEADYLESSMFSEEYDVLFSDTSHSVNGIAWKKNRFQLGEIMGSIVDDRVYAIELIDNKDHTSIFVASGHLTGCNPFKIEKNPETGMSDSAVGDTELATLVYLLDQKQSDLILVALDSNVTALHPRLKILKNNKYRIDSENFIEMTCANPYQVLNTRIDWIAFKSSKKNVTITNIPILDVGLNHIQTNISDHKPIASKIEY